MGIYLTQPMGGNSSVKEGMKAFRTHPDSIESHDWYGPAVSVSSKHGGFLLRLGILMTRA
jgi:hypothetical protein